MVECCQHNDSCIICQRNRSVLYTRRIFVTKAGIRGTRAANLNTGVDIISTGSQRKFWEVMFGHFHRIYKLNRFRDVKITRLHSAKHAVTNYL